MRAHRGSLLASVALLAACGGGGQGGALGSSGRVSVLLRDAPATLQAAVVTISEVDLIGSSGPLVLTTTETTTDLTALASTTASLVDGAVVPAGTYSQLRFVITGGYLKADGKVYASSPTYPGLPEGTTVDGTLRMPSYAQSGLKVDIAGGLSVGTDAKVVLVDFDASQSFGHLAGDSGAWVMHPVVKAAEVGLTGSLDVTLALGPEASLPASTSLGDFQAVLTPAGGAMGTPVPLLDAGDGVFGVTFPYLLPGDYTVSFQAPATVSTFTTDPAVPADATVASGQTTTASFLLLAATPPAPQ